MTFGTTYVLNYVIVSLFNYKLSGIYILSGVCIQTSATTNNVIQRESHLKNTLSLLI